MCALASDVWPVEVLQCALTRSAFRSPIVTPLLRHTYELQMLTEAGPDRMFDGRSQAQKEFAPREIVRAPEGRWCATVIALHRPGPRGAFG